MATLPTLAKEVADRVLRGRDVVVAMAGTDVVLIAISTKLQNQHGEIDLHRAHCTYCGASDGVNGWAG